MELPWLERSNSLRRDLASWMAEDLVAMTLEYESFPRLVAGNQPWFLYWGDARLESRETLEWSKVCKLDWETAELKFPLEPCLLRRHPLLDFLEWQGYVDVYEQNLFLAHLFGPTLVGERVPRPCILTGPPTSGKHYLFSALGDQCRYEHMILFRCHTSDFDLWRWVCECRSMTHHRHFIHMKDSRREHWKESWTSELGSPITLTLPRQLTGPHKSRAECYPFALSGVLFRLVLEAYWAVGGPDRPARAPRFVSL